MLKPFSAGRVIYSHRRSPSMFSWLHGWRSFAVVDTTRAGNPRLVAQHGYLTAHTLGGVPEQAWTEAWAESPLEDLLQESDALARLTKFELPGEYAPRVLELLKRYGVRTSSMFPDYAGIVQAVTEGA